MSPKKYTAEVIRRIIELKNQEWKQKDIAEELGIPESTVSVILARQRETKRKVKVVGVKKNTMYLTQGEKVAPISIRFPLDLLVEYNNLVQLGAVDGSFEDWILGHVTRKDRLAAELQVALDPESIELRKRLQRKKLQRLLESSEVDAEVLEIIRLAKAVKEVEAI